MALELNGTTGVSLVQDGVVVAADLNSALSDTIGKVKAWVNFNGTGTVAIRAGYNVSSITDLGTATYTANFTVALQDVNYATVATCSNDAVINSFVSLAGTAPQTTAGVGFVTINHAGGGVDFTVVNLAIFR